MLHNEVIDDAFKIAALLMNNLAIIYTFVIYCDCIW